MQNPLRTRKKVKTLKAQEQKPMTLRGATRRASRVVARWVTSCHESSYIAANWTFALAGARDFSKDRRSVPKLQPT
jgi:hypothetical protein